MDKLSTDIANGKFFVNPHNRKHGEPKMVDIELYILEKISKALENILYEENRTRGRDPMPITHNSWKFQAHAAQLLIDAYQDAFNSFNLPNEDVS